MVQKCIFTQPLSGGTYQNIDAKMPQEFFRVFLKFVLSTRRVHPYSYICHYVTHHNFAEVYIFEFLPLCGIFDAKVSLNVYRLYDHFKDFLILSCIIWSITRQQMKNKYIVIINSAVLIKKGILTTYQIIALRRPRSGRRRASIQEL